MFAGLCSVTIYFIAFTLNKVNSLGNFKQCTFILFMVAIYIHYTIFIENHIWHFHKCLSQTQTSVFGYRVRIDLCLVGSTVLLFFNIFDYILGSCNKNKALVGFL